MPPSRGCARLGPHGPRKKRIHFQPARTLSSQFPELFGEAEWSSNGYHSLRFMQRSRRLGLLAGLLIILFLASIGLPFASNPGDSPNPPESASINLSEADLPLRAPPGDDPAIQWTNVSGPTGLGSWSGNFLSWADFDADGDQDLLVNGGRLLVNSGAPNFAFTDQSGGRGIPGGFYTGTWGDIDNDGDIDLALGGTGSDAIYLNSGAPAYTFTNAGLLGISNSAPTQGMSLRDWDGDGWLDLYVMNGEIWDDQNPQYFRDFFYVNDQQGGFTNQSNLITSEEYYGRGISWGDYDRDFDSDLYVGNYRIVANRFYENRLDSQTGIRDLWERTSDTNDAANVLEGEKRYYNTQGPYWGHTIGSAFGDLNNDGYPEIVTANLVHLYHDSSDIRGLICDDSHFYTRDPVAGAEWGDMRPGSGIDFKPRGGSGTYIGDELYSGVALGDVDNDGDLDMWLPQIYDLAYAKAELWINNGDFQFTQDADPKLQVINTYGGTFVDYDNDGDLDLLTGGQDGVGQTNRLHLFRNDGPVGDANHWLGVAVQTEDGAPAVGASVEVWRNGSPIQYLEIAGAEGPSASGAPLEVHFGLGADDTAVDLLVAWPDNRIRWLRNVSVDQRVVAAHPAVVQPTMPTVTLDPPAISSIGEGVTSNYQVEAPSGWTVWLDVGAEGIIDNITTNWNGSAPQTIPFAFGNQGYRTTRLIVWDPSTDMGVGRGHTIQVTPVAPTARVEHPAFILPATFVIFDASTTEDAAWDRANMEYRWEWSDGFSLDFSTQKTYNRAFDDPGSYNLTMTARDEQGLTDQIDLEIIVAAPMPNGSLVAPDVVEMDSATLFRVFMASGTPNLENVSFRFDWADGSVREWNNEPNGSHVWTSPGSYLLNISIRNEWGKQVNLSHSIEVSNIAPTIDWAVTTQEMEAGDEAVFQVMVADTASDSSTLAVHWELDGQPLSPMPNTIAQFRVFEAGTHLIQATVSDQHGGNMMVNSTFEVHSLEVAEIQVYPVNGFLHLGALYTVPDTRLIWEATVGDDWTTLELSGIDVEGYVTSSSSIIIDLWSESRQERLTYELPILPMEPSIATADEPLCKAHYPTLSNSPDPAQIELLVNTAFGWDNNTYPAVGFVPSDFRLIITLDEQSVVYDWTTPARMPTLTPSSIAEFQQIEDQCRHFFYVDDLEWTSNGSYREAVHELELAKPGVHRVEWMIVDSAHNSITGEFTIGEPEVAPTQTTQSDGGFSLPLIPMAIFAVVILLVGVVTFLMIGSRGRPQLEASQSETERQTQPLESEVPSSVESSEPANVVEELPSEQRPDSD